MSIRKIKIRYIAAALVLAAIAAPFVIWKLGVGREMDIVVLNKTFPAETDASGTIKKLDYGKQSGLFWVMKSLGITNPTTNKTYNGHADYYGNFLSDGKLVNKPLGKLTTVPDVIFLSDMYGTGDSRANGVEDPGISGMTKEEVGVVATSYERGTTVIGEYNIAGDPTKASVAKELEGIFGVTFTGMAGKFFSDLTSTADVPNWIRATYEKQYGKKWDLSGAGIVIAGNDRIVVLQRNVGYTGSTLRIEMDDTNEKDYNTKPVDYYNWFELVTPTDEKSVIAWYDLDLTDEGANQLKPFGLEHRFPAIIANHQDGKHAYYLAGDFTDYRGPSKISQFIGASTLYRYFSVNSEGDLTYFYWHFYVPFMSKVLKDVEVPEQRVAFEAETAIASDGTKLVSKISDQQVEIYYNDAWNKTYLKGVNIGATIPGSSAGNLPDDPSFYRDWLEKIAAMNANTIRVYTLMPPAFYRALDGYNNSNPDKKLYLLQNIGLQQTPPNGDFTNAEYTASLQQSLETTINAIHGNAVVAKEGASDSDSYMNDVSGFVIGYLFDPDLTPASVIATNASKGSISEEGKYVQASSGASRTEAWLAAGADQIIRYEQTSYNMIHPVGVVSSPQVDSRYYAMFGPADSKDAQGVIQYEHIVGESEAGGVFGALNLFPNEEGFTDHKQANNAYADFQTYLNAFVQEHDHYPVLVTEFGLPTGVSSTEAAQGEGIVSMLNTIKESGAMGSLIYEWADEWGSSSTSTSRMIPYSRGTMWHNITEPAQNYGIMALESKQSSEYAMTLRGAKPLNTLALNADETYLYIKADFSSLPDLTKKGLHIYLDTIDRRSGAYKLSSDGSENWSGAEFDLNVQSSDKAELLVIPSYNASKGSYYTSLYLTGTYERMLTELSPAFKSQMGKTIDAQYEDASSLQPGPFTSSTNNFNITGNTVNIRIPWIRLNFTDPSSMLVLDDDKHTAISTDQKDALTVRMTDGIIASLVIIDKQTDTVDYHFPESATSIGYKTFAWNTWDVPQYEQRAKSSYDLIQAAFAE
ncbi:hypothetical protein DFQ01_105107 [Paenibacillus cellulosilyticus]|uniref:Uncharacterized protein n=1 Tax=Paenibacillus cellulosilyticus TaxID=375489 RepID=A0A2V2YV03_9BACL|nr:hypothetical protein [Paenibacillus cellulosilyticus]PWW05123.1 hypothetical protein DFQ01_105107 [Paenibacillus cellulosilyticus]QKS48672.1 hypothetical protein HUB94_31200 [Paenibacillus cellulosilyticus]